MFTSIKNFAKYGIGASLGLLGVMGLVAKSQAAVFAVSTSSLNAYNGTLAQNVYDYLTSTLTDGGIFIFGVALVIIAIVVHFAWRRLRSVFG